VEFEKKVARVTGGARGIGLSIAEALVWEGAGVFICGRDPATLKFKDVAATVLPHVWAISFPDSFHDSWRLLPAEPPKSVATLPGIMSADTDAIIANVLHHRFSKAILTEFRSTVRGASGDTMNGEQT
jgi:NAD(P)-dependent dehydrogenase (short-subunit alcohol dehydrogenase family)